MGNLQQDKNSSISERMINLRQTSNAQNVVRFSDWDDYDTIGVE